MQYVDTHTHLYDEAFGDDCDGAVERALAAGVVKLVFPDINGKVRDAMFDLAARHPGVVFPCLGLHPTDIGEDWREEIDEIERRSAAGGIVAIGEIGMDLHWTPDNAALQEEVLRLQLDIALERGLPVIIHNREATAPLLNALQDYRGRGLRGVFHAYGGSYETFREISKCGDFYVGIGGVVTFPKASIAQTVKRIPLDMILTETDSPYLTPVPFRGTRNESSRIPLIADKIAVLTERDPEEVAQATWDNAHRLFGLRP